MEQSRKIKLSCKGLGKTFKTPKGDFEVLRDLTFDVYENEFLVIFGPGQCGKTTLLNMLAGLEPSDGTVFHNGKTVEMPEPSRAMVYQTMALFPWMTVMDNVAFSQKVQKRSPKRSVPRSRRSSLIWSASPALKELSHPALRRYETARRHRQSVLQRS